MAYEVCKRCSKMFKRTGKHFCDDCLEKNEKELELITEFLKKNPSATVLEIIAGTGVSIKIINILVEKGSIAYVDQKIKEEVKPSNEQNDEKQTGDFTPYSIRKR
ncbi:hypothetical protein EDC19_1580 [Natranaerovirga hydrolytica]|uniref:Flagellar operon protein (TIGR03826 family) n=1 Tax=Natranaerovirga hydrolytica TaxID=680378 RepID=A0A4R1MLB4_9FIRM|nr:hypothetical protein [Natranaerovirga hydrolytica]TCK93387.1 hypothetical protein EDC19_1580 [Natranaerovirga hydrolytica]